MKIERINITLPSCIGKPVIVSEQISLEEMEYKRQKIVAMFEMYGFGGALISFAYHNCPGEIEPAIPDKFKVPEPVVPEPEEPETPITDLPQYKIFNIMNIFKK